MFRQFNNMRLLGARSMQRVFSDKKNELEVKKEEFDVRTFEGYVYKRNDIVTVNDPKNIAKFEKWDKAILKNQVFLGENIKFLFGGAFGLFLTNYLWQHVPHTVLFKHLALTDYITQKYYLHAPFLSALSVNGDAEALFAVFQFATSVKILGSQAKFRLLFSFFLLNALLAAAFTFWKKKASGDSGQPLFPTYTGRVTPIAFSVAAFVLSPSPQTRVLRVVPFFLIPLCSVAFEVREYLVRDAEEVKDLCKPND